MTNGVTTSARCAGVMNDVIDDASASLVTDERAIKRDEHTRLATDQASLDGYRRRKFPEDSQGGLQPVESRNRRDPFGHGLFGSWDFWELGLLGVGHFGELGVFGSWELQWLA